MLVCAPDGEAASPAPEVDPGLTRLLCHLEDALERVDLLPDGPDGLALRLVSEDPVYAVSVWQRLVAKGTPASVRRIRVERPRPKLAIVVDDLGLHPGQVTALWSLGQPLTYAVIPHLPHTIEYARWLTDRGASFLVHLPMQPIQQDHMTLPNFLTIEQRPSERRGIVAAAMAVLPAAVGVNNHMGSLLTARRDIMDEIVGVLPRGTVVIDSRTSQDSQLGAAARDRGLPTADRTVFLDNEVKVEAIGAQLLTALRHATERGQAIAIGHPHDETVEALRAFIRDHGHQVHFVSIERVVSPEVKPPWLRGCGRD